MAIFSQPRRVGFAHAIDPHVLAQVFDYALTTAQVSVAHVIETRRAIELQTAQLAARYATPE